MVVDSRGQIDTAVALMDYAFLGSCAEVHERDMSPLRSMDVAINQPEITDKVTRHWTIWFGQDPLLRTIGAAGQIQDHPRDWLCLTKLIRDHNAVQQ